MQQREYRTYDKSDWGPGPWQDEPDKIQFTDRVTGFPCLIVRNHGGALCGYVGVPEEHKAYHKHYDDELLRSIRVHGGLTFSAPCTKNGSEDRSICHIPSPGESDNIWWLGFDCAHSGDVSPAMDARLRQLGHDPIRFEIAGDKYRTVNYVKRHIAKLALQLHDM